MLVLTHIKRNISFKILPAKIHNNNVDNTSTTTDVSLLSSNKKSKDEIKNILHAFAFRSDIGYSKESNYIC